MTLDLTKEDFAFGATVIVSAVTVISGLSFDKSFVTVVGAAGTIATAVFGYLKARRAEASALAVARVGADAAIETNSKTVLVQTVTAERAKWRAEMRELSSELATLLLASARRERIEWGRADRLRIEIQLRLNPKGREPAPSRGDDHGIDRKLHGHLATLRAVGPRARAAHETIARGLEMDMADLLKGEWDKTKDEAVSGKLERRDG